ncbi:MAG TPA: hypothetical protein VEU29_02195, partial [Actinomycetota bacterium]|nr:hypothetical protein [Actinomycetota bacterium]
LQPRLSDDGPVGPHVEREAMEKRRIRNGLALAAVAIAGAAALAALLYGLFALALVVFWDNVSF